MTDAPRNYKLGIFYETEYDKKKAFEHYKLSADAGHTKAQLYTADLYNQGYGVPRDLQKACEYYELSANQGDMYAQYNLGDCYMRGLGVPIDFEKAVKYYKLSMAQGHKPARINLGVCYKVMGEHKKAVELFVLWNESGYIERLVTEFSSSSHTNDIVYMYHLCAEHTHRNPKLFQHRDVDLLKPRLKREYTESIPLVLIPDLIELIISYLI